MQEVIIYRNPLEALIWQGIMSPVFLVVVGLGALWIAVALLTDKLVRRRVGWQSAGTYSMWAAHVITTIAAALLLWCYLG